jgi:hypothetical protein
MERKEEKLQCIMEEDLLDRLIPEANNEGSYCQIQKKIKKITITQSAYYTKYTTKILSNLSMFII